jgi:hypothetical protein
MAAPTPDFLNQAQEELIAALKRSSRFMSPKAKDAPTGAFGVVRAVEDDIPDMTRIPDKDLPFCSVIYLRDGIAWDDSAASDTDYEISLGVWLYARGSKRQNVWADLKRAAAALAGVVAYEMSPYGSQFDGFATLARYQGGDMIDTEESNGYGALLAAEVVIQITLPDYEETP